MVIIIGGKNRERCLWAYNNVGFGFLEQYWDNFFMINKEHLRFKLFAGKGVIKR